ncbi:hypothetical protein BDV96DRAFT_503677 [Lophiotrema nucula]|uniref:Bacterial low temperature requirement A protein-domain-containing protein n=1 Tax=Lophiotrema nucula TaxID=690887 RepID=A0A6A5YQZ7_9PLEO|nr:hypothetical protein BDV96DRAFT_503677 [Lophiotrema nucula]
MSSNGSIDLEKTATSSTSGSIAISKTSSGNPIIYKAHHEASTIELCYDLFFVANLATLINYFKLFTLLWFTWLSTTLFDVRFSIDSVWNRLCKAVQFGVMTAFVFCGPIFDKYDTADDVRAYKSFAVVLCVSRSVIGVQYFVVMVQGRMFRQTLLPVGLSGLVHVCGSVAFLVTHFAFPHGGFTECGFRFVIAIVEGLLIFTIAIFWRIVSFKYTHLVERLQLLTLIIIGEGIIGMVKSVACITKGQSTNNSTEIGTVTAAVLLLYLLWMLYFDQLSHDRFGTVRQQIWSLLHYPLHGAILFCVEGNTSLIVWNSAVQGLKWIWSITPPNIAQPAAGFSTSEAYIDHLNTTMWDVQARFKSKPWNATYPWTRNLTAIANYTSTYGFATPEWNNRTSDIITRMFNNAQEFVFEAHADTLGKLNAVTTPNQSAAAHLQAIYDVFNVTVLQFYIGAGSMLLLLAVMYWFNKSHKTKLEFGEMITRVVVGFALIVVGVAAVMADKTTKGFKFSASNWIIAIVVLLFLLGKSRPNSSA